MLVKPLRGPFSAVAQKSVSEERELSHDCNEGDLLGFAGFDHGIVFGLAMRMEPHGVEGRHVQGLADSGSSAAD